MTLFYKKSVFSQSVFYVGEDFLVGGAEEGLVAEIHTDLSVFWLHAGDAISLMHHLLTHLVVTSITCYDSFDISIFKCIL